MAKEKRQLDRSKPYGQVYGEERAVFEQHGILFDGEGWELPGFEDVEIPEEAQVIVVDEKRVRELTAEVAKLAKVNQDLNDQLKRTKTDKEHAEAELEEVQGKLDSAEITIKKLQADLDDATAPTAEPVGPVEKSKKKSTEKPVDPAIDEQLSLQGKV